MCENCFRARFEKKFIEFYVKYIYEKDLEISRKIKQMKFNTQVWLEKKILSF